MRKSSLIEYIRKVVAELEQKPYEHWIKQKFPITYEDVLEGKEVQVQIDVLETTPEYIHLIVEASDSPLGWWIRKHVGVIIRRES